MGSTICTAGFPSPAIASSCFTARCASIWYGFFIATLLFSAKENCSQPIKRHRAGSRYFLRSTGHSPTTVSVLDRVAAKGNRSALIDRAIRHYVETQGRQNLRERLKQEALANAERDLQMAAEWFPLEEEAWQVAQSRKRKK